MAFAALPWPMSIAQRLVASAATAAVAVGVLTGCSTGYGADFGYPAAPPLPDGASLVVTDKGWDDDDPIRLTVQVIDAPGWPTRKPAPSTPAQVLDFYRAQYPASGGWRTEKAGPVHELCLVNRTNAGYTQVLDITPYLGSRVPARPHRHLVVVSRIEVQPRHPCFFAAPWLPSDLLRTIRPPTSGPEHGDAPKA
jgi:hypothetical protein